VLRGQLGRASPLLPTTDAEHRVFRALAVTAGICEEILVRGYLIWYFGSFMHPWLAMTVAAVVFGVGHLYQGKSGVVKTGAVGLLMGALYLGTGSLLWPMIVHAVGRAVLRDTPYFPPKEEPAS